MLHGEFYEKFNFPTSSLPENFVPKGWGYESWITNNEKYCGKLLFFKKGKKCSFHYHKLKEEHFYVHKGKLLLTLSWEDDIDNASILTLNEGEVYRIPIGLRHQMEALEDTELFEFSTQHFDEDSIRIVKGD